MRADISVGALRSDKLEKLRRICGNSWDSEMRGGGEECIFEAWLLHRTRIHMYIRCNSGSNHISGYRCKFGRRAVSSAKVRRGLYIYACIMHISRCLFAALFLRRISTNVAQTHYALCKVPTLPRGTVS